MTFKPGQSGNPGGGASGAKARQTKLREQLMHLSPRAIKELERMIEDPDHKQFAVKEILDRVWGKAPQSLELGDSSGDPLSINVIIQKK